MNDAPALLDEYLIALEHELRDLAPADRAEILIEVRDHFDAARQELPAPTEADLRNILERLGSPPEIASEARQRLGVIPAPAIATPRSAAGVLEVAALVGWVVWWPVGALLAAVSPRWSRRDKAIAVFIELVFFGLVASAFTTAFYYRHLATLVLLFFPPSIHGIFSAAYLGWRLASPGPRELGPGWGVAVRVALIVLGVWLAWSLLLGPALLLVLKARG